MKYRINIHDWKTLDGISAYTSDYVPNIGEMVDLEIGEDAVIGKVKAKIVRDVPRQGPVFYLYVDQEDHAINPDATRI
jgi:hypothetical protein